MTDNVIKFKKRRYKKNKNKTLVRDKFQEMVVSLRDEKINGFLALVWTGDEGDIRQFCTYDSPIDEDAIIGAIEFVKIEMITNFLNS